MKPAVAQFSLALRLVHWLMVVLLITMLFMVIVVVSVAETRTWRIGLHRRLAS
jgi:cytochrome b561